MNMNMHSRIKSSAAWRAKHIRPRPLGACGTAALEYAALGWEVFPVPPGTKQSYKSEKLSGTKWGKTTDPEEIGRDFRRWPDANVAIVTGAVSGIFVIEADTVQGHGVDGLASMAALETQHGPLPETLMAISPSGSIHRYYEHPGADFKVWSRSGKLVLGVDIKGDGGMVIAPPSIKPGVGEYRWLNDKPIANAPAWLIEAATTDKASETTRTRNSSSRAPSGEQAHTEADDPFAAYSEQAMSRANADLDLDEVEAALMVIPNDASVNFEEWNTIGMSLYAATSGSAAGFAMFDSWSQKYPAYDADDTKAKWEALKKCPPTSIGVGSIFYRANQASPSWRDDYRSSLIADAFRPATEDADNARNVDAVADAIDIFDAAQPLRGSLAETYLAGLGLMVPDTAHEVLRFHPHCRVGDQMLPCFVALVQDSLTNEPTGVHLSALGADATVIDRKVIGAIDCYSVIKLGGEPASGKLTIAASIEAALAAMMHGFTPAWSVLSAQGIADFPQPRFHNIKQLMVIIDDDDTVEAAKKCKGRWGCVARIAVPEGEARKLLPFDVVLPVVQQ